MPAMFEAIYYHPTGNELGVDWRALLSTGPSGLWLRGHTPIVYGSRMATFGMLAFPGCTVEEPHRAGRMFWFTWKGLSGSYRALRQYH